MAKIKSNTPLDISINGSTPFTVSTLSIVMSGSVGISGSLLVNGQTLGSGTPLATLVQSAPSNTWTFNHNLGILNPIVTIYGPTGNVIIPQEISASDSSSLTITFPTSLTGTAVAAGGTYTGVTPTNAITASYVFTSVSSSFATTASFALNAGGGSGFPFSGSAIITGSLLISGSGLTVTGSLSTLGSSILLSPNLTSTTVSQSYLQISGSIQQVQTLSSQIYGINIIPRMIYTTGSQTQTALRVAPTFSGSSTFSSSQQNIIADFGATSVGTQFSVNDITSGSIYMVNDVSGLPIIEALSDWTVNMYNYPTKIFQKTGSNIIITGSMRITGSLVMSPTSSFVLPLTASTSPAIGSAYWSGSFLFVYNGTKYVSASFA